MTEQQKIENEISILKTLLKKETNLLKQGELSAKIKHLTDSLDKQRSSIKNPNLKVHNPADLKSSNIGENESQKIDRDWQDLTKGKKK